MLTSLELLELVLPYGLPTLVTGGALEWLRKASAATVPNTTTAMFTLTILSTSLAITKVTVTLTTELAVLGTTAFIT